MRKNIPQRHDTFVPASQLIRSQTNPAITATKTIITVALVLAAAVTFSTGCKTAAPKTTPAAKLTPAEAQKIAVDAYIYGYPLVTMEYTRRIMTNVREPDTGHAPMGWLIKSPSYPNASYKVVTAPNADTLYTTAWLDVGKEPWILTIPDANGRYYLMPMLDGWTDVFEVPGTRTTGDGPLVCAITGPHWKGKLPHGVVRYQSPTAMVWLLGRIYCSGTPADYDKVHEMQDEITLVPLSSYGKPYAPAPGEVDPNVDMRTPVRDQVNALSTQDYFNLLAELMKENPPKKSDALMVAEMAKIGIVPGRPFDITRLDPMEQMALQDVPQKGFQKIMNWFREGIAAGDNRYVNGWVYTTSAGLYGNNYIQRALVAAIGLGANRPQDAIYPISQGPAPGQFYDGANKYVIHFAPGQLPPVAGFWSLTMYDGQLFFVDNPLNRYTLSARDDLQTNPDGSVDLYLQHDYPGKDKESNWLPAPDGRFILMLRLYWPKDSQPSIVDGSWTIPPVEKVNGMVSHK